MSEYKFDWAFIIETDGKAWVGNFERPMCAYCTGMVGQCDVGEEEAHLFFTDFGIESNPYDEGGPFEEYVNCNVMDDQGGARPAGIWKFPDKSGFTAVAIFFNEKPTDEQISIIKERAYKFAEERPDRKKYSTMTDKPEKINITGFRLIQQTVTEKEYVI